ncbi:MAG: hypothetical protein QW184_00505 [Nanopusillaceae archaeon]
MKIIKMKMDLPKRIKEEAEKISKDLPQELKEKFFEELKEVYLKKLVDVGEPVGLVAAQSISEPTTQLILRSFHYVGMREFQIALGLPRLLEIMDARKRIKNKYMKIHLLDKYKNDLETAKKVVKKIIEIKVEDVIDNLEFYILNNKIVIHLDKEVLKEYDLDFQTVFNILKKRLKKYNVEKRGEYSIEITASGLKPRELYVLKENIKKIHLSGIKGIKEAIAKKEGDEYVIYAMGSNFLEVMKLPEVDYRRVYTNDIHEIVKILGIEAARKLIFDEMVKIFENYGLRVDYRHFSLVADVLTWYGEFLGITRYGITAEKASTLSKAAFEIPIQNFMIAATLGVEDKISSSVDNLLTNQIITLGTGLFEVYYRKKEK